MIRTETRLQYANGYLDLGMTKAAQELDAIEDKDRLPGEYLTVRIRLHLGTRKWKRMELASKRLTELEPQNPYGWVNWAYALRERNRIKEAMSVAEAGLEFVPEEAVLWFNFACYCSLMGKSKTLPFTWTKPSGLTKHSKRKPLTTPTWTTCGNGYGVKKMPSFEFLDGKKRPLKTGAPYTYSQNRHKS